MFDRLATHSLPAQGGTLQVFTHPSGLHHAHLADATIPATFLIAFPTLRQADDGVAHILEHLVLSGSERYPVRELFSRLGERTLASYLNAFTTGTYTAYPFVSPHPDDFLNIVSVYLDAVFRPLLRDVDFRQEGVRVLLDDAGQAHFQGVVFNEMKGAFDDPFHHAYHALLRTLYPDSALGCESGGDPLSMTTLTREDVRAFHAEHYHPSRAWVWTAGPEALIEPVQAALVPYLAGIHPRERLALPTTPLQGVLRTGQALPTEELGWVWALHMGRGLDGAQTVWGDVFSSAAFTQDSSPWQVALQQVGLGRSGPLTGSLRVGQDHWWLVHVEGLTRAEEVERTQALLGTVLDTIAREGSLPMAVACRQFEGRHRMALDTGSAGAVHRLSEACEAALYSGETDLVGAVDPLGVLPSVQAQLSEEQVTSTLQSWRDRAQAWITFEPDEAFHDRREAIETRLVADWTEQAKNPAVAASLRAAMAADAAWMACEDEAETVPATPLERVPAEVTALPSLVQDEPGWGHIDVPLQGIGALMLFADVDHLSDTEALDAQLIWEELLPQVGMGELGWEAALVEREAVTTTLVSALESVVDQAGQTRLALVLSARGRTADASAIATALEQTVRHLRLDEAERIRYLLGSAADEDRETLGSHGDRWAQRRLQAQLTRQGAWLEASEGLSSLAHLQGWRKACDDNATATAQRLAHLYAHLLGTLSWTVVGVGEPAWGEAAQALRHRWVAEGLRVSRLPGAHPGRPPLPPVAASVALVARDAQSRHIGLGWPAPREDHADAPRLMLLAKALERPLFERLRSQGGAYGAWASYASRSFSLMTYRDPRLTGTLADLETVRSEAATPLPSPALIDAKRAVFQKLDRPATAWDQAYRALRMAWQGRTQAQRQAFRDGLRQATSQELADAARRWLGEPATHRVAYVPRQDTDTARSLGLTVEHLPH